MRFASTKLITRDRLELALLWVSNLFAFGALIYYIHERESGDWSK